MCIRAAIEKHNSKTVFAQAEFYKIIRTSAVIMHSKIRTAFDLDRHPGIGITSAHKSTPFCSLSKYFERFVVNSADETTPFDKIL